MALNVLGERDLKTIGICRFISPSLRKRVWLCPTGGFPKAPEIEWLGQLIN